MESHGRRIVAYCRPDGMTEVWNEGRRRLVETSPEARKKYLSNSPSACWTPDLKNPTYAEDKDGRNIANVKPLKGERCRR